MRNRTADLLLTMETLYRLSYEGQPTTKDTQDHLAEPNRRRRASRRVRTTANAVDQ